MCTETLLTLQSYCWIIYYCTRIEVSVLRVGRGRGGGGGGSVY